jgi:predicted porin
MTPTRTGVLLAFALGGLVSLHPQPAAVQQLQNNQLSRQFPAAMPALAAGTNAPELYQGENTDVGPQRILRRNPRRTYFDLLFDSQVFFSDNANFATAPNAIASAVFVNTVQAAFAPPAFELGPGKFSGSIGVASQWYNYGDNRLAPLDFNAQTFFVNGKYDLDKWQLGVGVNLTRLVNQENYDETYREFMPNLGMQRLIPLNDRMIFAVGDLVDYHLTEVPRVFGSRSDINDRLDNVVSLTFTWQATRWLVFQPFYRFQYSYYQHDTLTTSDRNDYLQSFGLSAAYYFNKNVSLRAFYSYNRKQSSDPFTPAYHEMNGGLGAALEIKF